MSCSFTKHELAQHVLLRSWKETTAYKNDLHLLPKQLNELAAYLHFLALGAVLTVWTVIFGTGGVLVLSIEIHSAVCR